jgi:hypothetical protein
MNEKWEEQVALAGGGIYGKPLMLLLFVTFILTLARAMALPYLAVYLFQTFGLGISEIGVVVGGALIVSSFFRYMADFWWIGAQSIGL